MEKTGKKRDRLLKTGSEKASRENGRSRFERDVWSPYCNRRHCSNRRHSACKKREFHSRKRINGCVDFTGGNLLSSGRIRKNITATSSVRVHVDSTAILS